MVVRASVATGQDPTEPPNPGQMARFPGHTALQSAAGAVRRPSPYVHPSGKPAPAVPATHQRQPETRPPAPLWTYALLKGDRNPPESVIGLSEQVIGIVGMRTETAPGDQTGGGLLRSNLRRSQENAVPPPFLGFRKLTPSRRPSLASRETESWRPDSPFRSPRCFLSPRVQTPTCRPQCKKRSSNRSTKSGPKGY